MVEPVGHDCIFNGAGERFNHSPWGLFGGGDGKPGEFLHRNRSGTQKRLPDKPIGVRIGASEAVVIRSPGAGGYGNPNERATDALVEDAESGKFGADFLRRHYTHWTPS